MILSSPEDINWLIKSLLMPVSGGGGGGGICPIDRFISPARFGMGIDIGMGGIGLFLFNERFAWACGNEPNNAAKFAVVGGAGTGGRTTAGGGTYSSCGLAALAIFDT